MAWRPCCLGHLTGWDADLTVTWADQRGRGLRYAWRQEPDGRSTLQIEAPEELGLPVAELSHEGALLRVRFPAGDRGLLLPLHQYADGASRPATPVRRAGRGLSLREKATVEERRCVWEVYIERAGGESPALAGSAVHFGLAPAVDVLFAQAAGLAEGLCSKGWSFVDGFLRGPEADIVHLLVRRWWAKGELKLGRIGKGLELQAVRSDLVAFLGDVACGGPADTEPMPEALRLMQERIDMLAMELCALVPCLDTFVECRPPFFAVYPGDGARYERHFDYGAGARQQQRRLCTLILYLNPFWQDGDGGALRLFPESRAPAADPGAPRPSLAALLAEDGPSVDVEPLHGRLLAFLCDGRNAHEVLPAWQPRMAVNWWLCEKEL